MKLQYGIASVIVMACGMAVSAQDTPRDTKQPPVRDTRPVRPTDERRPTDAEKDAMRRDAVRAGDTILIPAAWAKGTTVKGEDDAQLGTVEDVVVRGRSGQVVYLLVSTGVRPANSQTPDHPRAVDRVTAVPFAAFAWDDEKKVLTLPVTEEKFKAAQSFDASQWRTQMEDADRGEATYRYYQVPEDRLAWDRREYRPSRMTDPNRPMKDRDDLKKPDRDDMKKLDKDRAERPADRPVVKPDRDAQPDRTLTRADSERSLFRVEEIRGKPVRMVDGREFGQVNEVVFDAPSGRIAFLAVTPGSSMDAGEGKIAIPWPSFNVDSSGQITVTEIDKDALRNAPRLTEADWGDARAANYTDDLYKTYGYDTAQWRDGYPRDTWNKPGKERTDRLSKPGADRTVTTTERTINGKIDSIEKSGKSVVINVKSDTGEVVTVHTAPQSYLDQNKLNLKKGDSVRVTAKSMEVDGKQCMQATQLTAADGTQVMITPEIDRK